MDMKLEFFNHMNIIKWHLIIYREYISKRIYKISRVSIVERENFVGQLDNRKIAYSFKPPNLKFRYGRFRFKL